MKSTTPAIVFFTLIYGYLYFFTLNFNYVEGDDASTILYHLCGQNPEIQPPYAAYNSGLDFVLRHSGLQTEQGLRVFAIMLSFVSGYISLCLLVLLLDRVIEDRMPNFRHLSIFYLSLPILIPDFLFHSLIINASNISFLFLMLSLLYFVSYLKTARNSMLIVSMVAFALCVPFRWTMVIGISIFIGLFLMYVPFWTDAKTYFKPLLKIALANLAALILGILFVVISGYNGPEMLQTISGTTHYLEQGETSIMALFASASAFLTPASLLLVLVGLVHIALSIRSKKDHSWGIVLLIGFSASPFVLLGFYPMFKYSMTFLPALLLLMLIGYNRIAKDKPAIVLLALAVIVPWIVGIEVNARGTYCGPGFELNTQKGTAAVVAGRNPDNRIKIVSAAPSLNAGFYLPTPEGPRPLYGFGYALFSGCWKRQIENFTQERNQMYDFLIEHPNALYFQDRPASYFSADLYRHGFTTKSYYQNDSTGLTRLFTKGKDSMRIHIITADAKADWISAFFDNAKVPVVYRSTYSNDILKIQSQNKSGVSIPGPFTALKAQ